MLKSFLIKHKKKYKILLKLISFSKTVYFLGTPNYPNYGDSAITVAQLLFLKKCVGEKKVKQISQYDYRKYKTSVKKIISKNKNIICLVGGGNMGNQWQDEENFRQEIIKDYPNNKIIIFPQTIIITGENKEEFKNNSAKIYNSHPDLVIAAREEVSYKIMKELYSEANIILVPDIVLSMEKDNIPLLDKERQGVLVCFRKDCEKAMSEDERDSIINYLKDNKYEIKITDTVQNGEVVIEENREELVFSKINAFAKSKLVITDRLHGMIFSAITETPCIVFGNNNQKIKGTYKWIKDLPYISFCDNVQQAYGQILKLYNMKNCRFDNANLLPYYNELKKAVKNQ